MLFNSVDFAFFYLLVTSLFFIFPHKFRWFLLLAASCYFYMAFVPVYILILGFTIVIDYFAGIFIEQSIGPKRKAFLILSLTANIGILVCFKYFNFFNANISTLLTHLSYRNPIPFLHILLPLGLSFHTFQAMSYTIEVYRGKQKAERHFGIYSLYVMFYPQLVAGPIERPQNLLHQFYDVHRFNYEDMTTGLRQMAWGLFKKVVIADRLAAVVNMAYADPHQHNGLALLIAVLFFAFQIYCDFSGYSDIAIGAARTMGFRLMNNFDTPYQSASIAEFWQRWHISLSTWFKDYLYIPLGGNRVKVARWYANLFVVFLISGLWHGANWTFIIWGALHSFYLIFGLLTKRIRQKAAKMLRLNKIPFLSVIVTFILTTIAWIFFRAPDITTAVYIIKSIYSGIPNMVHHRLNLNDMNVNGSTLLLCFVLIAFLLVAESLQRKFKLIQMFRTWPVYYRWPVYFIFVLSILSLGVFENSQFIYFQF